MTRKKQLSERYLSRPQARGSVLVLTLWVIGILIILVLALTNSIRERIHFAKHFRNKTKAYLMARAGVTKVISELKKHTKRRFHCLKDKWSNSPEEFSNIPIGEGQFAVTYEYTGPYNENPFYGVIDEDRKININQASFTVLRDLIKNVTGFSATETERIAAAIIDWRDEDNTLYKDKGAENPYYQGLPAPYECKNKEFQVLEELLLVRDITPEIFGKIKNDITIYGNAKININTASVQVLMALGLTESLARKVIRFRAGTDGLEGTEDDEAFKKSSEVITRIPTDDPAEKAQLLNLSNQIKVKSRYYCIKSKGELPGKNPINITCIVAVQDDKIKIVAWQEH